MKHLRKIQAAIRKKAKENNLSFKGSLKHHNQLGYTYNIGNDYSWGSFEIFNGVIFGSLKIDTNKEELQVIKLAMDYLITVTRKHGYPILTIELENKSKEFLKEITGYEFMPVDLEILKYKDHNRDTYYCDFTNGKYLKMKTKLSEELEKIQNDNILFEYFKESSPVTETNEEVDEDFALLDKYNFYYKNHRSNIVLVKRIKDYYLRSSDGTEHLIKDIKDMSTILFEIFEEGVIQNKLPNLLTPTRYFFEKYVIKHEKVAQKVFESLVSEGYHPEQIEIEAAKRSIVRDLYWGVQDWNVNHSDKLTMEYTYYYGILYILDKYYVFLKEKEKFDIKEFGDIQQAINYYKQVRNESKYDNSSSDGFFTVEDGILQFEKNIKQLASKS